MSVSTCFVAIRNDAPVVRIGGLDLCLLLYAGGVAQDRDTGPYVFGDAGI